MTGLEFFGFALAAIMSFAVFKLPCSDCVISAHFSSENCEIVLQCVNLHLSKVQLLKKQASWALYKDKQLLQK